MQNGWTYVLSKTKRLFSSNKLHLSIDMRHGRHADWYLGTVDDEPAMFLHSNKWYVTNDTNKTIQILHAYLVKPKNKVTESGIVFTRHPEMDEFGEYPILPRCHSELLVDLIIQPPCRREGESLSAKITFVDNYNKNYKVGAQFEGRSGTGKLILCMKIDTRTKSELDVFQLPTKVIKKLARKGHSLAHNSKVLPTGSGEEWVIKDPDSPHLIYTAKLKNTELSLFKRFVPPPRQQVRRVSPDWQRA